MDTPQSQANRINKSAKYPSCADSIRRIHASLDRYHQQPMASAHAAAAAVGTSSGFPGAMEPVDRSGFAADLQTLPVPPRKTLRFADEPTGETAHAALDGVQPQQSVPPVILPTHTSVRSEEPQRVGKQGRIWAGVGAVAGLTVLFLAIPSLSRSAHASASLPAKAVI